MREVTRMKKNNVLKVAGIVLALVAVFAIICAIMVTGSGFLDLSNIVRAVCICVAVVCTIFAVVAWKYAKPKK